MAFAPFTQRHDSTARRPDGGRETPRTPTSSACRLLCVCVILPALLLLPVSATRGAPAGVARLLLPVAAAGGEEPQSFMEQYYTVLAVGGLGVIVVQGLLVAALLVMWRRSKAARDALAQSESMQRDLIEHMPAMVVAFDARHRLVFWNRECERVTGYRAAEVLGRTDIFRTILPNESPGDPDAPRGAASRVRNVLRRVVQADGQSVGASLWNDVSRDFPVRGWTSWSVGIDITEQKRMEEELRTSARMLEEAQRLGRMGSWELDAGGSRITGSAEFFRILGVPVAPDGIGVTELLGRIHPEDRVRSEEIRRQAHQSGTAYEMDYRILQDRGGVRCIHEWGQFERDAETSNKVRGFGTIQDVSATRFLEEQLLESQKMEAVGRLAGGVAHEFNNMLQVILGSSEMLLEAVHPGEEGREDAEQILQAGERAKALVLQLLTFSRKNQGNPDYVSPDEIIRDAVRMIRRMIGEHIELVVDVNAGDTEVFADSGQVAQILMNLCLNSKDAMPEGGTITIETSLVTIDSADRRGQPAHRFGDYVRLKVTDNGPGMSPEVRQKVFEPFFTTKEVGRGTGLGLAVVYAIVRHHDGFIELRSEPGEGTTFEIYLPIARSEEARRTDTRRLELLRPEGGDEVLLLAEDDAMVRRLAARTLERAGYTVLVAENGSQAVRLFLDNRDDVRLLILDVVMPGMNGREVYETVSADRPQVPVLFFSGYSDEILKSDYLLDMPGSLLKKPYRPRMMLRMVRELLDGTAPASDVGETEEDPAFPSEIT